MPGFTSDSVALELDGHPHFSAHRTAERAAGTPMGRDNKKPYGTFRQLGDRSQTVVMAYGFLQRIAAGVACIWVLWTIGSRIAASMSASSVVFSATVPSPSPPGMVSASKPLCKTYKYPGCEASLAQKLASGARTRCEAAQRIHAEGDFVQFPYLDQAEQPRCMESGCCGCPGQCSRCPPVLAECTPAIFAGSWRVAFLDGSSAQYNFDAHGHVEVELPSYSLPLVWKKYEQAYVPRGNDILDSPRLMSLEAGKELCAQTPTCLSITVDTAEHAKKTQGNLYDIWFKSVSTVVLASGTSWKTFLPDRHNLHEDRVAIAGALQLMSNTTVLGPFAAPFGEGGSPGEAATFNFNLHRVAPQFFPDPGSVEELVLRDSELRVLRLLPGRPALSGEGILIRS